MGSPGARPAVRVPVRAPSSVADGHIRGSQRSEGGWRIFDKRYWPGDSVADHLTFALRHEWLDLLVIKRVFDAIPAGAMAAFVANSPTGAVTTGSSMRP